MVMIRNVVHGQISPWIVVLAATTTLLGCNRGEKEEQITPERELYAGERWERQMVHASPVQVPGTQVTYEQTRDGAAITFVTRGDVDEVRRRAKQIAELHDRRIEAQVYRARTSSFRTEWCPTGQITRAQCRDWCLSSGKALAGTFDPPIGVRVEPTVDETPNGARIRFTLDGKDLLRQLTASYAASMTSLMLAPGLPDVGASAVSPDTQVTYEQTSDGTAITFMTRGDVDELRRRAKRIIELHDQRIEAQAYGERAPLSLLDWETESITCEKCVDWCESTVKPVPRILNLPLGVRVEPSMKEIPDGARIRVTLRGEELLRQLAAEHAAYVTSLILAPGFPDPGASAVTKGAGRAEK